MAITEFNDEAARFAAKYRIPAGAGSDAHVPQGLGSVRIRMREFDGPEEFLESLRDADIIRNPASLLYVQALKFLQTKALPEGRQASRERRVRRAMGRDRRGRRGATPQLLMHSQGQAREPSNRDSDARDRRRDPREVPRAGDPRAERVRPRGPGLHPLPARRS